MVGVLLGLFAFLVSLASYGLVVRRRGSLVSSLLPSLILFAIAPIVVALGVWALAAKEPFDALLMGSAITWSLSVAFLVANTAIESDSPTQSLVLFIRSHEPGGASGQAISEFVQSRPYRDSRLHGLMRDGVVAREGERLVCRPSGRRFLDLMDAYRRLIRRSQDTG